MKNNIPFNENKLSNNEYIRTFSKNIDENELKWHFDNEDRIIICNENTNWFFQKDNRLPQRIIKNKPIYIKEGEYHRLIKGDNDLKLTIIKSNREYLNESNVFHLSNNPNLVIDKNYKPKQGQLGKGFYVTKNVDDWTEESIGKRDYIYEIINFDELNIAKPSEQPSRKDLVNFGLENGFYKMDKVIKPNGDVVKDFDGSDIIRPIETDKYKKYAIYQDPMTGSSIDFLEQEYLKSKGFDGKEPYYSRDGHQIIIWNYDKIKLKRIK